MGMAMWDGYCSLIGVCTSRLFFVAVFHQFEKRVVKSPKYCDVCADFIYGTIRGTHGFECINCHATVHARCTVQQECTGEAPRAVPKGRQVRFADGSVERGGNHVRMTYTEFCHVYEGGVPRHAHTGKVRHWPKVIEREGHTWVYVAQRCEASGGVRHMTLTNDASAGMRHHRCRGSVTCARSFFGPSARRARTSVAVCHSLVKSDTLSKCVADGVRGAQSAASGSTTGATSMRGSHACLT